jgi:glucokinase
MHYLGIEIGGTKLQIGLGQDTGKLDALWRGRVEPAEGADGIRRQLQQAVPQLLHDAGLSSSALRGVGIGFGGPVDDRTKTILKSHQIEGWENFPLADWIGDLVGVPAVLGNDADCGGLGEALHGAGKGLSPIFYITIGSGIGGGLIIDGKIYRGTGKGAAEIGHMQLSYPVVGDSWWWAADAEVIHSVGTLESVASGWALEQRIRITARNRPDLAAQVLSLTGGEPDRITLPQVAEAAQGDDFLAQALLALLLDTLSVALNRVVTLLCPRRVIIGGGVALLGEALLFEPLRRAVRGHDARSFGYQEPPFEPFLGETDIVPAVLGEEMVVHGAIALARQQLG